jgi:(2R)-3-sulfolactate dehydrogenase (NADP+)
MPVCASPSSRRWRGQRRRRFCQRTNSHHFDAATWHVEPVGAQEGKPIPLGCALDREGHPTTDPKAGLEDSMLPAVELLVTAFTSARMGFEASSLLSMKRISPGSVRLFGHRWEAPAGSSEVFDVRIETRFRPCCRTKMSAYPGLPPP